MLRLYTQDNCKFCDIMKEKLDSWNVSYSAINISHNTKAKEYVIERGHRVVPQLYIHDFHINDVDTLELTEAYLDERLDVFITEHTTDLRSFLKDVFDV